MQPRDLGKREASAATAGSTPLSYTANVLDGRVDRGRANEQQRSETLPRPPHTILGCPPLQPVTTAQYTSRA